MPTKKKAAKRIKESGIPTTKTIRAKDKDIASKSAKMPARTKEDWKREEENEKESRSMRGAIGGAPETIEQMVAGDNYSKANWGDPAWKSEGGRQLVVSFWFPTQRCAIDYPNSEEELKSKKAAFKKAKVAYVGVLPGQPLKVDEARAQLKAQGAKIKD